MGPSLDNLGWLYRGETGQPSDTHGIFGNKILYLLLATGFLTVAAYTIRFLQLLLDLFILPGKSVRSQLNSSHSISILTYKSTSSAPLAPPPKHGPS